jgi:hypothetical protein
MRACAPLALALALLSPELALAQWETNEYEMRYGDPVDVTLDSLAQMPEPYYERAVRVSGKLDMIQGHSLQRGGDMVWSMGSLGMSVMIAPMPRLRPRFEDDARRWIGREIEITGVVERAADPVTRQEGTIIYFWEFFGPEEPRAESAPPPPDADLEDLVTRLGEYDGERVRVVGQFRGANLFGDLPSASRRRSDDWVLKSEVFAVWVTGKKPRGKGWKLDAKLRRDTGKWLAVEGRVRTVKGVVYIQADDLALAKAPSPGLKAEKVAPPPPPELKPPVIVFSLPLDGSADVAPDSVFKVQFSNDMDENSFQGRVGLRYAGRPRPGDRALDAVSMSYDGGRRALIVDPGDMLRAGRVVELILLPGIVDLDGQPLQTRPGHDPGGAVDVLRYRVVAGTFLTGPGQ